MNPGVGISKKKEGLEKKGSRENTLKVKGQGQGLNRDIGRGA